MDPYKVLGISKDATMAEVKKAYRKKARENHPDLNPGDKDAAERMNKINEAYDRITNPDKYVQEDARRAAANSYRQAGGVYPGYGSYGQSGSPYSWSGFYGFDMDDLFNNARTYSKKVEFYIEAEPTDSGIILQAISAINSKNYVLSLKLLNTIGKDLRDGRWFYLSAIANYCEDNLIIANDHIKKAMEFDPSNENYKKVSEIISSFGKSYRQSGKRRGFSISTIDPGLCCCVCLGIQMCIGGSIGIPCRTFYF